MTSDELLMLGRLHVRAHAPYFGRAVLRLIPHEDRRISTLGVTPGMVLYFNPDYLAKLGDEKRIGTRIWHEVQHVLRHSFTRLVGADPRLANICEDLAINTSGRHNSEWDFSPDGVLPEQYNLPPDLTAEEYYVLIPPSAVLDAKGGCAGQCGGAAGHTALQDLENELDLRYGRDEVEIDQVRTQTAEDIRHHEKTHGSIGGGWSEWARVVLAPPVIPWQVLLNNMVRHCISKMTYGDTDYSMARPSRRTYAMPPGPIRPGLVGEEIEFAIILDTSGSMDLEKHIIPCLREARGAIMQSGTDSVWFIQADVDPKEEHIRRVHAADLLNVKVVGRGGTDFRPALARAAKLQPRPSLVIYLTDGYGPAPNHAPLGMEVIWCLVGEQTKEPAQWGHTVRVKE